MKSQTEMILKHLQAGNSVTPLQALNLWGCFRLGARIFNLKQAGHPILTKIVKSENGKHFAKYSIQQDDSDMLFHECPYCNWRCNCSSQPCSCCNEA